MQCVDQWRCIVEGPGFQGLRFRVWGLGFGGFRFQGLGFGIFRFRFELQPQFKNSRSLSLKKLSC